MNQSSVWIICSVVGEFTFCLPTNVIRLLPLQVTATSSSTCAVSSAPISRCRPSNRTWWHGAPGSLKTPSPSHFPTHWAQRCFVLCWMCLSSSSTVYLSSVLQSAKKRNTIESQRKPQPNSATAAESMASWVLTEVLSSQSQDLHTSVNSALWVIQRYCKEHSWSMMTWRNV